MLRPPPAADSSGWMQSYLVGPDPPKYNEQALKNLLDDVIFIEREVKRLGKPGLDDVFDEIKSVSASVRSLANISLAFTAGIHACSASV